MHTIHSTALFLLFHNDIATIPDWAEQLAEMTRIRWTERDGTYVYTIRGANTPHYWRTEVIEEWRQKTLFSFFICEAAAGYQRIVGHCSLAIDKDKVEVGRGVSVLDAPRGAFTLLFRITCKFYHEHPEIFGNLPLYAKCSMASTASQKLMTDCDYRFAGLAIVRDFPRWWKVVMTFDSLPIPPFSPSPGILGNPLGVPFFSEAEDNGTLCLFRKLVSPCAGDGTIPPSNFFVLPEFYAVVLSIAEKNILFPG